MDSVATAANVMLERPTSKVLTKYHEVDVVGLEGRDLETYVRYAGIKDGDDIHVVWQGAYPSGVPFDVEDQVVPVRGAGAEGQRVDISNRILTETLGGQGFYSYYINGDDTNRSPRLFCYVGLLGLMELMETLSVPQVLESHDQIIAAKALSGLGANIWIAPYQAMKKGDTVTLVAEFYDEDGDPIPPVPTNYRYELREEDVGAPVRFRVPANKFRTGGTVSFHYVLKLAGLADEVASPPQHFDIRDNYISSTSTDALLDEVTVDNYDGGPLDPGGYPNGLVVRARQAMGAEAGDTVLLYWWSGEVDTTKVQSLRLDSSSVTGSEMQFRIPPALLIASADKVITLFYQIARKGRALRSEALELQVEQPRKWSLPHVVGASAESAGAVVDGLNVTQHAFVDVPADFELRPNEQLSVNWDGDPVRGKYIASTAESGNPRRFKVPASAIGANLEKSMASTDKRFPVTFRVEGGARGLMESPPLQLRIQPLAVTRYPKIVCQDALANGDLSIKGLGARDATLTLGRWAFMGAEQPLTISLQGVMADGTDYRFDLRDGKRVTPEEANEGKVSLPLPLVELMKLKLDSKLYVRAGVRFDDVSDTPFQTTDINIRA